MRGIKKIPRQDFPLKMQGGLCARGGVFAGHYGIGYILYARARVMSNTQVSA